MAEMRGLPGLSYGRSIARPVGVVDQSTGAGDLFRDVAHVASQINEQIVKPRAIEEAEKEGEKSVTRDAAGNIVYQKRDYLLPFMDHAYENAAKLRYLTETSKDLDRDLADAHTKHALDPDGFDAAVKGIKESYLGRLEVPEWSNKINDLIDRESNQHLSNIRQSKFGSDLKAAGGAIDAKISRNAHDVEQLVRQHALHTTEAQDLIQQGIDLINSKVNNPAFAGYTQEQADLDVAEFRAGLEVGAIVAEAEGVYGERGYEGAQSWFEEQFNRGDLKDVDPRVRDRAENEVKQRLRELETERKVGISEFQDKNYSDFNERAELGKLTLKEINAAADKGLISQAARRSLTDKVIVKESVDTDLMEAIGRIGSGGFADSQNSTDRKAANKIFEGMVAKGADPLGVTIRMAQQSGIIPDKPMSIIRGGLMSNDPRVAMQGLDMGKAVIDNAPDAFSRMPGGDKMAEDVELYRHYLEDLNMQPPAAAQRIIDFRDPARRKQALTVIDAAKDKLRDLTVRDALSTSGNRSWWGFFTGSNADPGFTEGQSAEILSDYKALVTEHLRDGADFNDAKVKAGASLKQLYGPTTAFGESTLMKYPPEGRYPKVNGSHDYIRQQAVEDARAALNNPNIGADDVYLNWDTQTASDWRAGRPPRYTIIYRDPKYGPVALSSGGWAPDPKRAPVTPKVTREQFDQERAKAKSMDKAVKDAAAAPPVY